MHSLTPANVSDLRASLKWRGTVGEHAHQAQIVWLASDACFALIAAGRIMATSADIGVLGACLVAERAEPGFIKRILDAADPPDIATLDPAARSAAQAAARANAARVRQLTADADERRRDAIRRRLTDVSKLTLDDLLG